MAIFCNIHHLNQIRHFPFHLRKRLVNFRQISTLAKFSIFAIFVEITKRPLLPSNLNLAKPSANFAKFAIFRSKSPLPKVHLWLSDLKFSYPLPNSPLPNSATFIKIATFHGTPFFHLFEFMTNLWQIFAILTICSKFSIILIIDIYPGASFAILLEFSTTFG